MTSGQNDSTQTSALVLAGGRGSRLRTIATALGEPHEKQFCFFDADKSLLQQTVDRLRPLVQHTTVVVCGNRRQVAETQLCGRDVRIVDQPADRGTGIGVLVGLLDIHARAPGSTVILSPADHAFSDDEVLRRHLSQAVERAHRERAVVLIGSEPDEPRSDFGWIVPDETLDLRVRSFIEKPPTVTARGLMRQGALFNTMMLAAPVEALLSLFARACPDALRCLSDGRYDDAQFAALAPVDFSHDVLARSVGLRLHKLPQHAGWTDVGDAQRLLEWLERRGKVHMARRVRQIAGGVRKVDVGREQVRYHARGASLDVR